MAERKTKHTPPEHTKQTYSHEEVVAGVRQIILQKFTEKEIADLKSWLSGIQIVDKRRKQNGKA